MKFLRVFFRRTVSSVLSILCPSYLHNFRVKEVAKAYDMYGRADEDFFANIYINHILNEVEIAAATGPFKVLDAGCGQGRIAIPLAGKGYIVDGVDFTGEAVEAAGRYAGEKGVNVNLYHASLEKYLQARQDSEYDMVICTEVLYMCPNYDFILTELARVLKPGGTLAISVRPKLYYAFELLSGGDWKKLQLLQRGNDGLAQGWFYNWFSAEELKDRLSTLGFPDVKCYGIGILSGIEDDPQISRIRPSTLTEHDRVKLFNLEMALSPLYVDSGRYILAIGKKVQL